MDEVQREEVYQPLNGACRDVGTAAKLDNVAACMRTLISTEQTDTNEQNGQWNRIYAHDTMQHRLNDLRSMGEGDVEATYKMVQGLI